jgi:hypothetical protein
VTQRQWKARVVIEEATIEVAFLFTNEDVKFEMSRILKMLAAYDDPRTVPTSSGLDVTELEEMPGWFRVKVARYGIRVIYRLVIIRENRLLTIERNKPLPEHQTGDECYVEVMQAGYRKDVYGKELRRRYWKYN